MTWYLCFSQFPYLHFLMLALNSGDRYISTYYQLWKYLTPCVNSHPWVIKTTVVKISSYPHSTNHTIIEVFIAFVCVLTTRTQCVKVTSPPPPDFSRPPLVNNEHSPNIIQLFTVSFCRWESGWEPHWQGASFTYNITVFHRYLTYHLNTKLTIWRCSCPHVIIYIYFLVFHLSASILPLHIDLF